MQWGGRHFIKSAIHTVANLELILKGLEVNVTGSVLNRLHQHQIDKLDDGHVIVFQRKIYRTGIGHHHLYGVRNHVTQFVNFGGIERIDEGHLKHFIFQPHRDALILLGGFCIHDLLEFIGDHGRIHSNNRSA